VIYVKTHVVAGRNARERSAQEHLAAGLRRCTGAPSATG
jgi:hypothetical protein